MKNRVYLVDFDFELDVRNSIENFYEIEYVSSPIAEYVFSFAQGIIVNNREGHFEASKVKFYKDLILLNKEQLELFRKKPLAFIDSVVGRERKVNPKQFELVKGSIVRNKIDGRLSAGVVIEIEKDLVTVRFPNATKFYPKTDLKCHKSNLRVITHISEVRKK